MDFSPLILAAIVATIGMTEGVKKKFPNMSSTKVSILSAILAAISLTNFDGFTAVNIIKAVQGVVFNLFCIIGGSWLMYESIIKKYKGEPK